MLHIHEDNESILRTVCKEVPSPISEEDKATLKEMAEYFDTQWIRTYEKELSHLFAIVNKDIEILSAGIKFRCLCERFCQYFFVGLVSKHRI